MNVVYDWDKLSQWAVLVNANDYNDDWSGNDDYYEWWKKLKDNIYFNFHEA
jgi:hypothetical protein